MVVSCCDGMLMDEEKKQEIASRWATSLLKLLRGVADAAC